MKPRARYVIAALAVSATAAALLPSRLDAVSTSTWRTASTSAPKAPTRALRGVATLVDVKVTTAGDDWESAQQDALRAQGRRRLVGAGCTNPGPGTNAYSLEGTRIPSSVTAHLNPRGAPVSGAASILQTAFNTWKAADANAPSVNVVSDGTATTPSSNGQDEIMFKPLGRRTLGITYTWHWSTGGYESDMAFNTRIPWFQAPGEGDGCYEGVNQYDFQSTATHEAGHMYGLAHTSAPFNTMYYSVTMGETYKRSLAPGDAAGLRAIYG